MPEHSPSSRDGRGDEEAQAIDELVFQCLERLERDGWIALDELCRDHPDYAAVLRGRVEALRACGWLEGRARDANR
jgi:hypothetical protein